MRKSKWRTHSEPIGRIDFDFCQSNLVEISSRKYTVLNIFSYKVNSIQYWINFGMFCSSLYKGMLWNFAPDGPEHVRGCELTPSPGMPRSNLGHRHPRAPDNPGHTRVPKYPDIFLSGFKLSGICPGHFSNYNRRQYRTWPDMSRTIPGHVRALFFCWFFPCVLAFVDALLIYIFFFYRYCWFSWNGVLNTQFKFSIFQSQHHACRCYPVLYKSFYYMRQQASQHLRLIVACENLFNNIIWASIRKQIWS